MPAVAWSYGKLPPGWLGGTNLRTGQIAIKPGLLGQKLVQAVRHEAVHRWLAPSDDQSSGLRLECGRTKSLPSLDTQRRQLHKHTQQGAFGRGSDSPEKPITV